MPGLQDEGGRLCVCGSSTAAARNHGSVRRDRGSSIPVRMNRKHCAGRGRELSAYPLDMAFDRIIADPARMRGLPCIRGTRITVSAILGQLAAGRSIDEILGDYPQLERDDVLAALTYAAADTNERVIALPNVG